MTRDDLMQAAMQIIMHAGDAREANVEALDLAADGNFQNAREKWEKASEEIVIAHRIQTDSIQDEIREDTPAEHSLLFTHAQDTLMTINSEILLTGKILNSFEKLNQRLEAIENKLK